jgi:hypothetical protein
MQWTDVIAPRDDRQLRQFAGLTLIVFGGLAVWRAAGGHRGAATIGLAVFALAVGLTGLWKPAAIRPVFQLWMIAAFPIGWVISNILLAFLFFGVFTPIGLVFRLMSRDALNRRGGTAASYWQPGAAPPDPRDYFRQSWR